MGSDIYMDRIHPPSSYDEEKHAAMKQQLADAMDDVKLIDFFESSEAMHIAPYGIADLGFSWNVHDTDGGRIYFGHTMREAMAKAVLKHDPYVPVHFLEGGAERHPRPVPEAEAVERGILTDRAQPVGRAD